MCDAAISLSSGVATGFIVKTAFAPLSRLTIILQTQNVPTGARAELKSIVLKEGCLALWKSNLASIAHKAVMTGTNYAVYERIKIACRPIWRFEDNPGFAMRTVFATGAGCITNTVAYPFDLVRTILACDRSSAPSEVNLIWNTFGRIIEKEGWRGLYRGLPCTLLCQGPNIGLNFGIYETLNTSLLDRGQTRTGVVASFGCGAVAGCVASCIVHPLDLIRRQQQMKSGHSVYESFKLIREAQGWRGFYRGLLPELTKVVPAVGLNFYVYEYFREQLHRLRGSQIAPR